jgi:hypothetical protein
MRARCFQTGGILGQLIQHDDDLAPLQDVLEESSVGGRRRCRGGFHLTVEGLAADLIS